MRLLVALATAAFVLVPAGSPAEADDAYRPAVLRWRAADQGFNDWALSGAARGGANELTLLPSTAQTGQDPAGDYEGRNFYNGGEYTVGEATSTLTHVGFPFSRAVVSWNAVTPPGTWIEVLAKARVAGPDGTARETKFYNLGVWASDADTVQRHSVKGQRDADGNVAVDTVVLSDQAGPADGLQVKVRLFSARPAEALPTVTMVAATTSPPARRPAATSAGDPARWNKVLDVPTCSQRVYTDGGETWCSPTSTSMVLGYWSKDTGPCEPRVRAAVDGTYDWTFDGYGNWPFNTAYAAGQGLESLVVRFTGLDQVEAWIAAGIPVVVSYSWTPGALPGAPVNSSDGHLGVVVGFDGSGNPVMNDPAGAADGEVRRTYPRVEFENLWLEHSGGTAYLMYPPGMPLPAF